MKIKKMLLSLGTVAVMMCSVCAVNANAYNSYTWKSTDGTNIGYVHSWLNGGTYTDDDTLYVIGSSTLTAYTKKVRNSKYALSGYMSVNTYVEGSVYSSVKHKDATNCNSLPVNINGKTYVTNPKITSSNLFSLSGYGKASFTSSTTAF